MARIVISGATGVVGSHLVPLFGLEDELHLIARQPADAPGGLNVQHKIDLFQLIDAGALSEKIDAIIYLSQSHNHCDFRAGTLL
jgi:NAD dependent epimerase/dehydratase family enzyme